MDIKTFLEISKKNAKGRKYEALIKAMVGVGDNQVFLTVASELIKQKISPKSKALATRNIELIRRGLAGEENFEVSKYFLGCYKPAQKTVLYNYFKGNFNKELFPKKIIDKNIKPSTKKIIITKEELDNIDLKDVSVYQTIKSLIGAGLDINQEQVEILTALKEKILKESTGAKREKLLGHFFEGIIKVDFMESLDTEVFRKFIVLFDNEYHNLIKSAKFKPGKLFGWRNAEDLLFNGSNQWDYLQVTGKNNSGERLKKMLLFNLIRSELEYGIAKRNREYSNSKATKKIYDYWGYFNQINRKINTIKNLDYYLKNNKDSRIYKSLTALKLFDEKNEELIILQVIKKIDQQTLLKYLQGWGLMNEQKKEIANRHQEIIEIVQISMGIDNQLNKSKLNKNKAAGFIKI